MQVGKSESRGESYGTGCRGEHKCRGESWWEEWQQRSVSLNPALPALFYCREMLKPSFFCIRAWRLRDFLVRSLWNSAVSARFILLCQKLRLHPIRFWCTLSNEKEPFICWQVFKISLRLFRLWVFDVEELAYLALLKLACCFFNALLLFVYKLVYKVTRDCSASDELKCCINLVVIESLKSRNLLA